MNNLNKLKLDLENLIDPSLNETFKEAGSILSFSLDGEVIDLKIQLKNKRRDEENIKLEVARLVKITHELTGIRIDILSSKYKGSKNAGTPSVFFLDNEQQKPLIEQTQVSDLDKQYSTLTEAVKESVVMGHSIPRIVAGLEKSGSLGGSKEIVEANMVFYTEYVSSNQQFIEKYFNKIMKINGLDEIYIQNSKPSLHLYSENLLKEVLTKDEIRELFGYEPNNEDTIEKNDDLDNE